MAIRSKAVEEHLYVGIKGGVLALRKHDGKVTWFTKLRRGSSFVPIIQEGDRLYAASGGEVTCLDATSGAVLWHNTLKGYGTGYASLAGAGFPTGAAALEQAARAAAAAGATAAC
jgi:outer membrane protein assembly factor BamB